MELTLVRVLFALAGAYDVLCGLGLLFFGPQIFDAAGIPHPNPWASLQFGSLMLLIFAAMFFTVAYAPHANRNLIRYGLLLKLGCTALAAYYWVTTDIPLFFKPFVLLDAVMYVLFLLAYLRLPQLK